MSEHVSREAFFATAGVRGGEATSSASDLGGDGETRGVGGGEEVAVGVFEDVGPVRGGGLGFPCVVGFAGVAGGGGGGWGIGGHGRFACYRYGTVDRREWLEAKALLCSLITTAAV